MRANRWDPAVLDRFRSDPFVREFTGAFDARATTGDLEYLSTILPAEWMAASATGTPQQCTESILRQFDLGADSVILHGATPVELEPILGSYRAERPQELRHKPVNPGRSQA